MKNTVRKMVSEQTQAVTAAGRSPQDDRAVRQFLRAEMERHTSKPQKTSTETDQKA